VKVNLTKRVQTSEGLRYCPVVEAANGRVKPDYVAVNGAQEKHPEGAYYLEWYERGKRRRLSVGKNAAEAYALKLKKEAELNATAHGITVSPALPASPANGKRSLSHAISDYLAEIKLTKKPRTLAAYSKSLAYFTESCPKLHLEDIERRDLLKFSAFLRDDKNQSPRSLPHAIRTSAFGLSSF